MLLHPRFKDRPFHCGLFPLESPLRGEETLSIALGTGRIKIPTVARAIKRLIHFPHDCGATAESFESVPNEFSAPAHDRPSDRFCGV